MTFGTSDGTIPTDSGVVGVEVKSFEDGITPAVEYPEGLDTGNVVGEFGGDIQQCVGIGCTGVEYVRNVHVSGLVHDNGSVIGSPATVGINNGEEVAEGRKRLERRVIEDGIEVGRVKADGLHAVWEVDDIVYG